MFHRISFYDENIFLANQLALPEFGQLPHPLNSCYTVRVVTSTTWYAKYNLHDYTYIQPGSLTQKYEAFRPLYFTWQDSSAGAMIQ